MRWQPSSPGTSCLPGAHSPAPGTLSRGRAAPAHTHHGRGKLRQGLSHQGGQHGSRHKFWGSQATGTCSPEHSVLSPCLHARLPVPLPVPRRAHPPQDQKLRMPENLKQTPKHRGFRARPLLSHRSRGRWTSVLRHAGGLAGSTRHRQHQVPFSSPTFGLPKPTPRALHTPVPDLGEPNPSSSSPNPTAEHHSQPNALAQERRALNPLGAPQPAPCRLRSPLPSAAGPGAGCRGAPPHPPPAVCFLGLFSAGGAVRCTRGKRQRGAEPLPPERAPCPGLGSRASGNQKGFSTA